MTWFDIIPVYFKHVGWYAGGGLATGIIDAAIRVFVLNQGDAKFDLMPSIGFLVGMLLTSFALIIGIVIFSLGLSIPAFASGGRLFSRLSYYFAAISGIIYVIGLYVISDKTSFDWPLVYGLDAILVVVVFYSLIFVGKLINALGIKEI